MKNSINNTSVDIRSLIYFLSSLRRKRLRKYVARFTRVMCSGGKRSLNKLLYIYDIFFSKFLPLATQ